jgi:hypothetical protein
MKISQKQASLLSRQVIAKLKSKKSFKVSDLMKAKIKDFVETRKELIKAKNDAQEAINRHDRSLGAITGDVRNLYHYDSQSAIIEKMEKKNVPSEEEVCDEIILNAMFANDEDLTSFIEKIAKKFEKNLQAKVVSN